MNTHEILIRTGTLSYLGSPTPLAIFFIRGGFSFLELGKQSGKEI